MSYNDANMTTDFPSPRRFESTDEQIKYNDLARYLELSKLRRHKNNSEKRSNAILIVGILLVFALICLLMQVGSGAFDVFSFETVVDPIKATLLSDVKSDNSSTPSSEWKKGTTPYLYQTDSAWAETKYADGTISTHGCGPTCLSMAYIALTGKNDKDPEKMAQYSEREGFIDSGVTSWLLMSQGARMLGLSSKELPLDAQVVRQHIGAGNQIICSVSPGDFTTEGHFILIAGIDGKGNLIVRDPNSPERSHLTWDINRVLSQCRNIWALSA